MTTKHAPCPSPLRLPPRSASTLVLAFASFWIGEHLLGLSGVVTTLTAGLTIAWRQRVHRKEVDIAFAIDTDS